MLQARKPLSSVLIKPAGPDCNLDCTYCFYLKKAALFPDRKIHRMSLAVLEEMVKQIMQQGGSHVSFGWQGGEPTLMGLPFFEKAVAFQQRYGRNQSVGNGLQTNGLLIDAHWAEFLGRYNFLVGLSLDGPQHIHDHYRLRRGGQGSWTRVMDSAHLLLDSGVQVNALTVLNDYSADFAEEIYNFHKELGLNFMQFIPCVETDPADPTRTAAFSLSPQKYGHFLQKVFDLWYADFRDGQPTTSIRYFDSVFHNYVNLTAPECTLLHECGVYVVIEHTGDVYSCDFYVEPEWHLGNVMASRLSDMLNSAKQKQFGMIKTDLPQECRQCEWLTYCRGGCPKDRQRDPRDEGLNHFCQSFKMFFGHADGRLRALARQWQQNQNPGRGYVQIKRTSGKVGPNDPCTCGSGKKYKKCCGMVHKL